MEELKTKTVNLTEHLTDLFDSYYKLAGVTATEKATIIGSGILGAVVVSILTLFILFFAGFGLAWWLGDILNNRVAGFLIVAGFFLVVMIILVALRKSIVFPYFRNAILRRIYG